MQQEKLTNVGAYFFRQKRIFPRYCLPRPFAMQIPRKKMSEKKLPT